MKKTLLSAASFAVVAVSAIAAAPTTSEAIPAFARQTGAACLSCHFQTFPAINSFGRAFKMGAFTDVGEQALIEDDNLSLPSVMNTTFVLRAQYEAVNDSTAAAKTTNWNVPADAVLMIGGRVGSNTGAFIEADFGNGVANWQLLNSFDFDSVKAGLNIINSGFGPTGAIEISNVFGQHGGKLNGKALSAVESIINIGNTTSIAGWVGNETFLVQVAAVAMADANAVTSPSFVPMLRATYIADLGAAELVVGAGILSGTQKAVGANAGVNATFFDVQVQGEAGDMSYGVYGDFVNTKARGVAPGTSNNIFAGTAGATGGADAKKDGYSIRAEISPIHKVMFGLGLGQTKETAAGAGGVVTKVLTSQVAFTYEIYQNMEFNAFYSVATTTATNAADTKVKTTFAEVEALF